MASTCQSNSQSFMKQPKTRLLLLCLTEERTCKKKVRKTSHTIIHMKINLRANSTQRD